MPLFIDGETLETSDSFFSGGFAPLQERSRRFVNTPTIAVAAEQLLYICQKEYGALLPSTPELQYIGSEDATTCHIVVLRHTASGAVCLGHFDGVGTEETITNMLCLVKDLTPAHLDPGRLELHIFGGFLDPDGTSRQLSVAILDAFQKSSDVVHLVTACISEFNDVIRNGVHFPVIYGIGVDVTTGSIFKATFIEKQPDNVLRSARLLSYQRQMVKVFDNCSNTLVIEPFNYSSLPEYLALLSDAEILEEFSTSPEQEPPGFVEHIRRVIRFTSDNPNPALTVFPLSQALVFKMNRGQWLKVSASLSSP